MKRPDKDKSSDKQSFTDYVTRVTCDLLICKIVMSLIQAKQQQQQNWKITNKLTDYSNIVKLQNLFHVLHI